MEGLNLSYSADLRAEQVCRPSWRDPRTRAIVADALELAATLVQGLRPEQIPGAVSGAERKVRGKATAWPLTRAIAEAWRVGLGDLEDGPDALQERLRAGHYLPRTWSPQAWREALRRLHEVCPELFQRVDEETYRIPLGELRQGGGRLERLAAWVDRARLLLYTRADRGSRPMPLIPPNSQPNSPVNSGHSKDHVGTLPIPRSPLERLEGARRDLRRLGPARQGEGGDRRTFVAACIGGDWGLEPEQYLELLRWYSGTCAPPWEPVDLNRKLRSAARNRKRPFGYKCRSGDHPPDPRRGRADARRDSADAIPPVRRDIPEIWERASRLTAWREDGPGVEGAALRWLRSRGLEPARLAERDVARVLPRESFQPGAEFRGLPWSRAGYALVLPTYDAAGQLGGVRARWVGRGEPDGPKELVPHRGTVTGQVLANPAAQQLLAGDQAVVLEVAARRQPVWIVEGGPDFLTMSQWTDAPVIGVVVGAWTAAIAARVPTGAAVLLATHADPGGEALARGVVAQLGDAVEVHRVRWRDGRDVNDAWVAGELGEGILELARPCETPT